MSMNEKDRGKLLQHISEVSFAIYDCALFLDTHPKNERALEYYQKHKCMREEALQEYEHFFGPLLNTDVNCDNEWTWVSDKWPWEGEC